MNWQDERRMLDTEALRGRPAVTKRYPVRIPHATERDFFIVVEAISEAEARAIAYSVYALERGCAPSNLPAPLPILTAAQRIVAERIAARREKMAAGALNIR